jgi:hypothetical protein
MTRGGRRRGAGQPPIGGVRQSKRWTVCATEAEYAEVEAAVPAGEATGPWIKEAALMRARRIKP